VCIRQLSAGFIWLILPESSRGYTGRHDFSDHFSVLFLLYFSSSVLEVRMASYPSFCVILAVRKEALYCQHSFNFRTVKGMDFTDRFFSTPM